MYWASGAIHGPHHIMKEWAEKYKGKFDDGWDKYRERVFARTKEKAAPLVFTANDCLDIGVALGSPVSLDYCHKAPFKFNGSIESMHVQYTM